MRRLVLLALVLGPGLAGAKAPDGALKDLAVNARGEARGCAARAKRWSEAWGPGLPTKAALGKALAELTRASEPGRAAQRLRRAMLQALIKDPTLDRALLFLRGDCAQLGAWQRVVDGATKLALEPGERSRVTAAVRSHLKAQLSAGPPTLSEVSAALGLIRRLVDRRLLGLSTQDGETLAALIQRADELHARLLKKAPHLDSLSPQSFAALPAADRKAHGDAVFAAITGAEVLRQAMTGWLQSLP